MQGLRQVLDVDDGDTAQRVGAGIQESALSRAGRQSIPGDEIRREERGVFVVEGCGLEREVTEEVPPARRRGLVIYGGWGEVMEEVGV